MTRNDKTPGVNENTWLIGTLNYEWEYLRVNKGDYRKSMNIYLNFSNLQLRRSNDGSFLSDFILTVNPIRVKITFEEIPQERIVRMKCLKFVRWEGFNLKPIEGAKWGRLKWLVLKMVQLLSSNFIVKYAIQSTLANRLRSAFNNNKLRLVEERMLTAANTSNKQPFISR
ncbi:unnamed protein product [Hymenolepis diminuta]|uniref:Endo/exonuclease/phosphatase domain-containing protein n=1 Tax=Hymenolepis diminuta TaxID=6216 RepID=A0A0R3SVH6_HYMDI|nr:unnamed protein product [Hymenolepis diminuta]